MKKVNLLLTLIIGMAAMVSAYAQNDTFVSVQDVLGKQIYVMPGNITPCTYALIDGKLKLVQKDKKHTYTITRSEEHTSELQSLQ